MSRRFDGLQRVAMGDALWLLAQLPFVGGDHVHLPRQRLPRDSVVLDQRGDLHPLVEQRGDDFAEPVAPVVREVVLEARLAIDVGPRGLVDGRRLVLEVRVADHERIGSVLIQRRQHWCASRMNSRPPAASSAATTSAQRAIDGSQHRAPTPV